MVYNIWYIIYGILYCIFFEIFVFFCDRRLIGMLWFCVFAYCTFIRALWFRLIWHDFHVYQDRCTFIRILRSRLASKWHLCVVALLGLYDLGPFKGVPRQRKSRAPWWMYLYYDSMKKHRSKKGKIPLQNCICLLYLYYDFMRKTEQNI